jgi:hypothetical protein
MNDEGLADEPPLAPFVYPDFTQEVASARAQYEGPPKAAFGPHFLAPACEQWIERQPAQLQSPT